LTSGT